MSKDADDDWGDSENEQEENSEHSDNQELPSAAEFLSKIESLFANVESSLQSFSSLPQPPELQGKLKDFQLHGFHWLVSLEKCGISGILADEMGCGKTIQTLAYLLHLKHMEKLKKPVLILAPLSIADNWFQEIKKFSPSLETTVYVGSKDDRQQLQKVFAKTPTDVVISTYELCNKDFEFFSRIDWSLLVVDEAHRLKNKTSLLYGNLGFMNFPRILLLTGTPIQNNFDELHALLQLTNPSIFKYDSKSLVSALEYASMNLVTAIQQIIKPFMLRRLKEQVVVDLPGLREVILYSGVSTLQKKVYVSLLKKDLNSIETKKAVSMANILMQLRKCVNHPYIFPGVEPEPFQMGPHLIESSGKLVVLDKLLDYLKAKGHRVLIFSQMTAMLDILQDYLDYKEYTYDRLDGSVRGDDRVKSVSHFSNSETFAFLLSTRAGGVGLNLTAADVVIFYDSDFNPQADLQAAARVHRIGQTKDVLVVRLVCKGTVEEIILKRAQVKASLTQNVLSGIESLKSNFEDTDQILKFGLDTLLQEDDGVVEKDIDFYTILGKPEEVNSDQPSAFEEEIPETMYCYEGKDYMKTTKEDQVAFQKLRDMPYSAVADPNRKRKPLDRLEDEYELLEVERLNRRKRFEIKKAERKQKLWEQNNYISLNLPLDLEKLESISKEESSLEHVFGSFTCPISSSSSDIIAFCVDNSGEWTTRGVFRVVSQLTSAVEEKYATASTNMDLNIGDNHLVEVPLEDRMKAYSTRDASKLVFVSLIVGQKRSKNGTLSDILPESFETSLERLSLFALENNSVVHVPHMGDRSTGSSYLVERLLKKSLCDKGVVVKVYYYRANRSQQVSSPPPAPLEIPQYVVSPGLFEGLAFQIVKSSAAEDEDFAKKLSRYIWAHGGTVESGATVTHIVSLRVFDKAIMNKSPAQWVTPEWVIDSIVCGALEDEKHYSCSE